jgi:predicted metal-dependent phosphoesterase TrpH
LIKADLHVHTHYSMDCSMSFQEIIDCCLKQNINCIAVCDHGTIQGALKLREIAPFKIIIAEEIATSKGEIMGMFLSEEIASNCPLEEAIKRIKEQNGLVCVPHPADALRSSALGLKNLYKIIGDVDIIETFNARNYMPGGNAKAEAVAHRFGKLRSAGSDAHTPGEIGMAFVQMEDFITQDDFHLCLGKASIQGKVSNPLVHLASTGNRLAKKFASGY